MKKKNALVIVLLLHCALPQNCFASNLETLEETLRFCNTNGHVYIALLNEGAKAYHQTMKSSSYDLRIKSIENLALGTMDTLIVQKDKSSLQFDDILEIMNTRKRQKSILVIGESEVEDFKVSLISFVIIWQLFHSHFLIWHLENC